jgi:hypothetical protein
VIFVPPLQAVFHTVPIPMGQVLGIGVAASLVLWVEEVRKRLSPKAQGAGPTTVPRGKS